MELSEALKRWKDNAERDLEVSRELLKSKHYIHSLFFLHLAIEKLIKALHQLNVGTPALPIHDLRRLANRSKIVLTTDQEIQLDEITTYNIAARYDDYKQSFYKKATPEYTTKWLEIGIQVYNYLLSLLI